jgi:hypothetical protein
MDIDREIARRAQYTILTRIPIIMGYLTVIVTYITVERGSVICQIVPVNRLWAYRTNGRDRDIIDEYT